MVLQGRNRDFTVLALHIVIEDVLGGRFDPETIRAADRSLVEPARLRAAGPDLEVTHLGAELSLIHI